MQAWARGEINNHLRRFCLRRNVRFARTFHLCFRIVCTTILFIERRDTRGSWPFTLAKQNLQEQLFEIGSNGILSLSAAALDAHLAGSLISSALKRCENESCFYSNIKNMKKTTARMLLLVQSPPLILRLFRYSRRLSHRARYIATITSFETLRFYYHSLFNRRNFSSIWTIQLWIV